MAIRRRTYRQRTCQSCGCIEDVRADNPSAHCQRCAARTKGAIGLRRIKARPRLSAECPNCGRRFDTTQSKLRRAARHFCSWECRSSWSSVARTCKWCSSVFRATRGCVAGLAKSNSSANFCNRACYHRWLCKPDSVSGRGSQWGRVRKAVLAAAPFCARCGTRKRLDIHHIVPFRITHDNRLTNLIPLCKKCHKRVESILNDVVLTGISPQVILLAFGSMLRDRQLATFMKIREVVRNG